MTPINYLMIQNNVVINIVLWDGNPSTWTPPSDVTMKIDADTMAIVWKPVIADKKIADFVLCEEIGASEIGFTWDGSVCTTDKPKPAIPKSPTLSSALPVTEM